MPDINGWLSEFELEYLRLYKMYNDNGLTDGQLKELSEIARLLYPPVSNKLHELGFVGDDVMIKAAYNIAMTGGKRAGYILLVDRGRRIEYMRFAALSLLRWDNRHLKERRYIGYKAYSLDGLLRHGYEYNHGLKTRRLGNDKFKYRLYG